MKIQDCINETEIKGAAFSFEYKGYTISTSNLFGKYEVLFWSNKKPSKDYSAPSVELAINTINKGI